MEEPGDWHSNTNANRSRCSSDLVVQKPKAVKLTPKPLTPNSPKNPCALTTSFPNVTVTDAACLIAAVGTDACSYC